MAGLFHILAGLALLAAVIAWGVAVRGGLCAIAANRAAGQGSGAAAYVLLAVWPFAVLRRGAEADADRVRAGKAAIAFFVAVTVAVAAISAYTNLTFKRDHAAPSGALPAGPASAPTKS